MPNSTINFLQPRPRIAAQACRAGLMELVRASLVFLLLLPGMMLLAANVHVYPPKVHLGKSHRENHMSAEEFAPLPSTAQFPFMPIVEVPRYSTPRLCRSPMSCLSLQIVHAAPVGWNLFILPAQDNFLQCFLLASQLQLAMPPSRSCSHFSRVRSSPCVSPHRKQRILHEFNR